MIRFLQRIRREAESTAAEEGLTPRTYAPLTALTIWEYSPRLLLAAVLFTLFCVPAVSLFLMGIYVPAILAGALTIVPVWSGLLAWIAAILEEEPNDLGTMLAAFRHYWGRSVVLGLLAIVPLLVGRYTLPLLASTSVPFLVWSVVVLDVWAVAALGAVYQYTCPLLVLHDMGVGRALRNGAVLASRHLSNTLGLLGMAILFFLAAGVLLSGLSLFLPTIWSVFIVNNCRLVLLQQRPRG